MEVFMLAYIGPHVDYFVLVDNYLPHFPSKAILRRNYVPVIMCSPRGGKYNSQASQ